MEPNINLTHVVDRVKREHPELTESQLKTAVQEYKAYWVGIKNKTLKSHNVPSWEVDYIWHAHILHTKQYDGETKAYFGNFLHHTPIAALADTRVGDTCCTEHGNNGDDCGIISKIRNFVHRFTAKKADCNSVKPQLDSGCCGTDCD